ncbi:MAG: hypothetical protein FJ014_03735 [Chloroflexi bacterium]|nr:hypothetical protein [Chloroflexota bacterium]
MRSRESGNQGIRESGNLNTDFLITHYFIMLIIAAYLVVGVLYAVNTPPWEVPDEPAHYNYIKYLAENYRFPVLQMGDYPHDYLEEIKARQFPPEMSIEPLRYEFHQPPLYYVLAAVVYKLFDGSLLPLRLLSVLPGCCLLWVAYHIVKEIFPSDETLALGTAAFVAFVPMHVAMTAAVNNDTLAELILALILWMLVRYVKTSPPGLGGIEGGRFVGLGVLIGLGLLTKITTLVAVPVALAVIVVREGWIEGSPSPNPSLPGRGIQAPLPTRGRLGGGELSTESSPSPNPSLPGRGNVLRAERLRRLVLLASGFLLPALLLTLPWFLRNVSVYGGLDIWGLGRHDAIVIGQPRTAEWLARLGAAGLAREFILTTFRSFWAQFGWMGILVDQRIYLVLALLCAVVGLGLILFVIRNVRQRALSSSQRMAFGFLALSALFTLLSYLWYNLTFVQHQGRYLFTALVPLGLAFALGLREILSRDNAKMAVFLFLAGGLILIVKGLATGDFNRLSIFLLGGAAAAFGVKALLSEKYDDLVFALPYLGLFALDLICLFKFIVPYFQQSGI